MEISLEHSNPVQVKLKVLVPAADMKTRVRSYYEKLAKQVRIPGFRPGKAPREVVAKFYGADSASELSERIIAEYVYHAVKDKNLEIVMPPVLLATDLPAEDKDFHFEVEIDLKPKLPDLNLKDLAVTSNAATTTVADAEIDEELNSFREKEANFKDVSEPRAITDSDCVVVSYTGTVDGEAREGMKSESQTIALGQKQFLPDFEAAIIGLRVGEEKTFDVYFPETYMAADLQGKTAQFHAKILGLKEKSLPALDDELAQSIDAEVKTLAELREKIRARLQVAKDRENKTHLSEQVGKILVERHSFQVSPRQVQAFAEKIAQQTHQMMHQMGMKHEESEEHFKGLMESSMKRAEHDVRLSYILEQIAREQKFEVEKEDFERRFEATAQKTGLSIAHIKTYYTAKDEESGTSRLERLRIDILDEKSLDYALSQATIKSEG